MLKTGRMKAHFGIDAGSLTMMRWAGTWCREPSLRARLISLLHTSKSFGGCDASCLWADALETLKRIEEADTLPSPVSCTEIAEACCVRLQSLAFYWKLGWQRIDFLRFPYNSGPESAWIRIASKNDLQFVDNAEEARVSLPNCVFGPAYLDVTEADGSVSTIRSPDFYFVIPKP